MNNELTLSEALSALTLKFKSGNSVPVDRATITKEELNIIAITLADLQLAVIDLQERLYQSDEKLFKLEQTK